MDHCCIHAPTPSCPEEIYDVWTVYSMGRRIGNNLETFSNRQRGKIIRELQKLEKKGSSKLSIQLMRLENYRLNKTFFNQPANRCYYAPLNYSEALLDHVMALPKSSRLPFLNKIVDIIQDVTEQIILV